MTYIVTHPKGGIKENIIRLHDSIDEASTYGKKEYGFGHFVIKKYSVWKKTQQAKYENLRIKTLERIRRFK